MAEDGGALAGLGLVTFAGNAPVPFAIVEDLIIGRACRGKGIGAAVMDWIAAQARARNIAACFSKVAR